MKVLLAVEIIATARLGGALDLELEERANGLGRSGSGAADRLGGRERRQFLARRASGHSEDKADKQ
jgi:hypothetical protein